MPRWREARGNGHPEGADSRRGYAAPLWPTLPACKDLTPESRGPDGIAGGFQKMEISDHEKLEREFLVYDALSVYCGGTLPIPRPSLRTSSA
jgi:hypothetical protein